MSIYELVEIYSVLGVDLKVKILDYEELWRISTRYWV